MSSQRIQELKRIIVDHKALEIGAMQILEKFMSDQMDIEDPTETQKAHMISRYVELHGNMAYHEEVINNSEVLIRALENPKVNKS